MQVTPAANLAVKEESKGDRVKREKYIFFSPWLVWLSGLSRPKQSCQWIPGQVGHMPGLWRRAPVGGCGRGSQSVFLSLSFSLLSPLSKNK